MEHELLSMKLMDRSGTAVLERGQDDVWERLPDLNGSSGGVHDHRKDRKKRKSSFIENSHRNWDNSLPHHGGPLKPDRSGRRSVPQAREVSARGSPWTSAKKRSTTSLRRPSNPRKNQ